MKRRLILGSILTLPMLFVVVMIVWQYVAWEVLFRYGVLYTVHLSSEEKRAIVELLILGAVLAGAGTPLFISGVHQMKRKTKHERTS